MAGTYTTKTTEPREVTLTGQLRATPDFVEFEPSDDPMVYDLSEAIELALVRAGFEEWYVGPIEIRIVLPAGGAGQ